MSGAIARVASLLPTAIATFATSRLVITHFGIPAFDGYVLALSLIAIVPLDDLGVGTAVASAFASHEPGDPELERVVLAAARVVAASGAVLVAISVLMSAAGLWEKLLGPSSYAGAFFGLSMAVYALTFVPALGSSMLLGVHRNHVTVLVQTFFTPVIFGGAVLVWALGLSGRWLVVVPAASLLVIHLATSTVASRITRFSWRSVLAKLPDRRRHPGARIRHIAGPRLIISVTIPLAWATDRVMLSHFSTSEAVAAYSVCMQIFSPVLAVIAASAAPLWPIFVAAKTGRGKAPNLAKIVAIFCVAAALVSLVVVALADPIGAVIAGDTIDLGLLLPVTAGIAMVVAGATLPISMAMTTPAELRFAARLALVSLPLNMVLSAVLAARVGAAGPLLATAAVGLLLQTVPAALYIRAHPIVVESEAEPEFATLQDRPVEIDGSGEASW